MVDFGIILNAIPTMIAVITANVMSAEFALVIDRGLELLVKSMRTL